MKKKKKKKRKTVEAVAGQLLFWDCPECTTENTTPVMKYKKLIVKCVACGRTFKAKVNRR